jgi:hypothetical protein
MKRGLTRGETIWLRHFINGTDSHNNSGYVHKCVVKRKIKSLLGNLENFSVEEISLMIRASERPEMEIDPWYRKQIFDLLPNEILKSLEPFNPLDKLRLLKGSEEVSSLKSKEFAAYDTLFDMLKNVNTHPGISYEDLDLIFHELGIDPADMDIMKNDDHYKTSRPTTFDTLRKLPKNRLQSAVKRVIFGNRLEKPFYYIYWSEKEHLDEQFLLEDRKRALRILKEIKNGIINRKKKLLKELYIRGLINEKNLKEEEMIETHQRNTLELAKKCKFNKGIFNGIGITCECIKNIEVFKAPESFYHIPLNLTEYGEKLLKKLTN